MSIAASVLGTLGTADLDLYPIDDVVAMADSVGGITLDTVRTWTDVLLAAKMNEYYAGTLAQTSDPGQGKRSAWAVFWNTLGSGVEADVVDAGAKIAEGVRRTGEAALKVPEGILQTAKFLPLIAVGVVALVLTLKVS